VLRYYADGVERTLTDEQVAIFRHTEIQELLRERRERAGADAELADRPSHTGSMIPAEVLSAESRALSPTPSSVHDKELCEPREKEYPGVNARGFDGRLNSAPDQLDTVSDGSGQDLGQALSAEQSERTKIEPCLRRIVRYEEDNLAPQSHQSSSTISREASFAPKFHWPKLRH
jgi:hypothetical protein